jgi:hypothetical protein
MTTIYDIDGEAACDQSGHSVSMNGADTIVAIGSIANDTNSDNLSGHVHVFYFNGSRCTQTQNLESFLKIVDGFIIIFKYF